MVEEFLKSHWLILINIPVFAVSVGSLLIFFGTYNRYTRLNKDIRMKFLSDLEKEKRKMSRELHDSISSFTILLKDYFSNNVTVDKESKHEWQTKILNFEKYIANVNENIYPSEFLEGNLYTALKSFIGNFKITQLNISLWINDEPKIHRKYGIHIYRIIQESIVNITKHTDSKFLTIFVSQDRAILKIILNYSMDSSTDSSHFGSKRGKKIIDERIKIVNGKKEIIYNNEVISEVFSFNIIKDEYSYN